MADSLRIGRSRGRAALAGSGVGEVRSASETALLVRPTAGLVWLEAADGRLLVFVDRILRELGGIVPMTWHAPLDSREFVERALESLSELGLITRSEPAPATTPATTPETDATEPHEVTA